MTAPRQAALGGHKYPAHQRTVVAYFKRPCVMFLYIFHFWAARVEVVIQGLLLGKIILSCVTFVLLSNICLMM